jgi:hypothetical protein
VQTLLARERTRLPSFTMTSGTTAIHFRARAAATHVVEKAPSASPFLTTLLRATHHLLNIFSTRRRLSYAHVLHITIYVRKNAHRRGLPHTMILDGFGVLWRDKSFFL